LVGILTAALTTFGLPAAAIADAPPITVISAAIQTSRPTPVVSNLKAGDVLHIVATANTDDTDEDGDDNGDVQAGTEALLLQVTGQLVVIGDHNVPVDVTIHVGTDGDTLLASMRGFDGDESGDLTVTVDPNTKQRLSQQAKDDMKAQASRLEDTALGFSAIAAVCAPGSPGCGAGFGLAQVELLLTAKKLRDLTVDPPDPNFKVIVTPVVHSLPDIQPQAGTSKAEADAFNALLRNTERQIAFATAMRVTMDRAQGAADAGDAASESKQVAALLQFAGQLAALLDAYPGLFTNLVSAVNGAGFPTTTLTPADVLKFEKQVAASGLPADEKQALTQLGLDQATIDALGKRAFVLDTQQVAGTFPAKLADRSLLDAIRATAQALRADIAANTPAPQVPPAQPTGGQGVTTPGFPNTGDGSSSRITAP